jgi:hypothetical protein
VFLDALPVDAFRACLSGDARAVAAALESNPGARAALERQIGRQVHRMLAHPVPEHVAPEGKDDAPETFDARELDTAEDVESFVVVEAPDSSRP